jgi:ankyrin repeat protein
VVALLLEDRRGAQTDLRDINGDTALHFAASHNHLKVLPLFSFTRPSPSLRWRPHTPPYVNVQIVKMLLKKGASPNILNEKKLSPLDVATPSVQSYLKVSLFRPMFESLKKEIVFDDKRYLDQHSSSSLNATSEQLAQVLYVCALVVARTVR